MTTIRSQVTTKSLVKNPTSLSANAGEVDLKSTHTSSSTPRWILVADEMDTSQDGKISDVLGDPSPPVYRPPPSRVLGSAGYQLFTRGRGSSSRSNVPPSLQLVPIVKEKTFRFQAAANATNIIQYGNLLGALGVIGTTITQVACIASSVRLHRITIYPSLSAECWVEWALSGGYTRDEIKNASVPTGMSTGRSLTFRPPSKSLLSDWVNESVPTLGLCSIFTPTGCIVDVTVSYTQCASMPPLLITVASAAVGSVYYLALDGPTLHKLPPSALPTTF
jgi:hypothetical protein